MHIIFVYNISSGARLDKFALSALCKKYGITVDAWVSVEAMQKKLPPLLHKGVTVAVVGGDGTINAAAAMVKDAGAILAPLPGGTLNHFTKDLGIPQDIEDAIKKIKSAKVYTVDIVSVNGKSFINNSSIGLYPTSLRMRDRFEKRIGKWPSAVYAALRAMIRLRLFSVTIKNQTFKTPFVFIGNNIYHLDGVGQIERKSINKGVISVFVAKTSSRLLLLKIALFALLGKSRYVDEFDTYELTELTIHMKRRFVHVSYDGEVVKLRTPLHYIVHKKALKVLY